MLGTAIDRRKGEWPPGGARVVLALAALMGLSLFFPVSIFAAEAGPMTFMGVKVKPHKGAYLVLKDVNIRARAETKSKKLGSLKRGEKVNAVARAGPSWLAVRGQSKGKIKDLGFVYYKFLLPLIDGSLSEVLKARIKTGGGVDCAYSIKFVGRSPIEGQVFQIADYDVFWDCLIDKKKVEFRTPMFMTEAPYQMDHKRIFQISVDVLDINNDYDDIFSSIVLYERDKKRVLFDSVSIEKFGQKPSPSKIDAKTVPEALIGAAKIAALSWKNIVWQTVRKGSR